MLFEPGKRVRMNSQISYELMLRRIGLLQLSICPLACLPTKVAGFRPGNAAILAASRAGCPRSRDSLLSGAIALVGGRRNISYEKKS